MKHSIRKSRNYGKEISRSKRFTKFNDFLNKKEISSSKLNQSNLNKRIEKFFFSSH